MQMHASLAPLERVVAKYRRDVHQLAPGAPSEALTSLEGHLGRRLPPGLRQFLETHNGASLLRGSLRIRATSELALASEDVPEVHLFADGPGDTRWAWAGDPEHGYAFGAWDGARLRPMHATFAGWFAATLGVIESRVLSAEDEASLRLQLDPDDPWQLVAAGERALRAGRPEEAERHLRDATTRAPDHVLAWQLLGDALSVSDRAAARAAWLRALKRTHLPAAWPGAGVVDPEVFRALAKAFPEAELWEQELARFLAEQVRDVVDDEEAAVVVAAAAALGRSLAQRGKRAQAREALSGLLARCQTFRHAFGPWSVVMELASLEAGLGHHDEVEALIRRVRREGPPELHGPALLLLGALAVSRQEPWAEEILDEAQAAGLDAVALVEADALRVERMVRNERTQDAEAVLERAARVARRLGLPGPQAQVCLMDGDLGRVAGDAHRARAAYTRAVSLATGVDAEIRWRAELRLGDLAEAGGDLDAARTHWESAARGFAEHGLPVREGWALLRVARLASKRGADPTDFLRAARDRFTAADLAAGVSAVDAFAGQPGASLEWHLQRAAIHARSRHDAQRPKPPWTRADADRPERRLGAHRLAIAACSDAVVDAIAVKLDAAAQSAAAGRGRARDPQVLGFVAACDLLSGHRSYAAAQVLLHHLLHRTVEGVPWRALQGAIARSPNAALVDGLLRAVENPVGLPGPSVAAAAELLGLRREPAAVKPLVKLASPGNKPVARAAAVAALGRIGNRAVTEAVAAALPEPTLAEAAALSLLMLGDRRGIDFHGRALLDQRRDLSGHPGEIVGRYGGPDHLLLLQSAAEGSDDRALGALQGLGLLGDPRGVPTLLDALHSRERRVVEVAAGALSILTGHEEDVDESGWRNRWLAWWDGHSGRFPDGVRHRMGKVFDFGLLLDRMEHADAWTRRTAYDELVIGSGVNLAFDAEGPWRLQQGHLRAWKDWWAKARHRHLAGRWFHDGKQIH